VPFSYPSGNEIHEYCDHDPGLLIEMERMENLIFSQSYFTMSSGNDLFRPLLDGVRTNDGGVCLEGMSTHHRIPARGGEALISGQTCTIRWATPPESEEITGISIEYSVNGGVDWGIIAGSTANDFVHDWVVPMGDWDHVKVKIIALYIEFSHLADDTSDGDVRIISSDDIPSVSLISPNPYVPGAMVFRGGEAHDIEWSATCYSGGIYDFGILLSLDNGTSWSHLMYAPADATSKSWTVPEEDTFEAKIRVEMELHDMSVERSQSVNPFYIFTETIWNRPPVAEAPETLTATEGETAILDGSASSDPDHDPLEYLWEQVDSTGFDVTLSDPTTAPPPSSQASWTTRWS